MKIKLQQKSLFYKWCPLSCLVPVAFPTHSDSTLGYEVTVWAAVFPLAPRLTELTVVKATAAAGPKIELER